MNTLEEKPPQKAKSEPEVKTGALDPKKEASTIVTEIAKQFSLPPEAEKKLKTLIASAVDERVSELDDIRLGRILGSALAAL